MKKRKPNPDAWPLRRGDLPAAALVADEPRLAGIEDNCVFRMAAFHRHLGGWFTSRSGSAGPIFLVILFGSLYLNIYGSFGPLFVLFLLRYSGGIKGVKRRFFEHTSVPEPLLVELDRTTYSPADFAIGLWGVAVAARRLRASRLILISLTAIVSLAAFAILVAPGGFEDEVMSFLGFLILSLSILSFVLTTLKCAPYHVLPRQAGELWRIQRSLQARGKFGVLVGRFLGALIEILGVLVLAANAPVIFNFFFALVVAAVPDSVRWTSRFLWLLFALGGPALGMALGLWRARYVRVNAERYLQRMTEDLSYILDWFAHEAAEPPPPDEKL